MSIKFEDNELRDLNRSDFDVLVKSFSIDDRIFKKTTAYRNFMSRFNVYTNLHFDEVAFKYVILNNVVIFSNENKYRYELQAREKLVFD